MFGEYSIKQKNIVVKNNITEKGKKQILNILSKNEKEVGYKKINHKGNIYPEITQTQYYYFKGDVSYIVPCYGEITKVKIVSKNKGVLSNSIFNVTTKKITLSSTTWDEVEITLTCKTKKEYKSTFFDFGTVSHPYNYLRSSSYKNLTSNVIATEVLTQNGTLNYKQADKVLDIDNKQKVDWGTKRSTASSNSGSGLDSYKTWFNVSFGVVEEEYIYNLPISESNYTLKLPHENILNGTMKIVCQHNNSAITNYRINYSSGEIYFDKSVTKNFYEEKVTPDEESSESSSSEKGYVNNIVTISYKWSCAKDIQELKNGICGVYVNAKPSVTKNSSTYNNENYLGLGCFSCDFGATWNGSVFPWKGQEVKNFHLLGNTVNVGHNMTGFYALGNQEEHTFLTIPYSTISPTNFAFAFCTDGNQSFFMKNLVFFTNSITPNTPCQIKLLGDEDLTVNVEWCGIQEDNNGIWYAEWKGYLYPQDANGIYFRNIQMLFSDVLINTNEIKYPDTANTIFSQASFETPWQKQSDETIEISYKIYFN